MQDRRMFLTGAAASMALPLVGGGLAWAAQATGRRAAPPPDVVLDEIHRQLLAVARRVTSPGGAVTGEVARQLSSTTRLLGTHLTANGFDAKLRSTLKREVESAGRAAFLSRRADPEFVERQLRGQGLEVDLSRIALSPDSPEQRGKALDFLLQNGVGRGLQRLADGADRAGAELDKFVGGRLVRVAWPWSSPDCGTLQWDLFMLEIMMIIACGPLIETGAACAAASATYIAYWYLIWSLGC